MKKVIIVLVLVMLLAGAGWYLKGNIFIKNNDTNNTINKINTFTLKIGETAQINSNLSIKLKEIKYSCLADDVQSCMHGERKFLFTNNKSGVNKEVDIDSEYQENNVGNFSITSIEPVAKNMATFKLSYSVDLDKRKKYNDFFNKEKLELSTPKSESVIVSPVSIVGQANDSWFFNDVLKIALTDNNKKELSSVLARVKGKHFYGAQVKEEDKVNKFFETITFNSPKDEKGWIIIKKENSNTELEVPIYFKEFDPKEAQL